MSSLKYPDGPFRYHITQLFIHKSDLEKTLLKPYWNFGFLRIDRDPFFAI